MFDRLLRNKGLKGNLFQEKKETVSQVKNLNEENFGRKSQRIANDYIIS